MMEEFKDIETILWDFDGVIVDSMRVRSQGFKEVLADYPAAQVDKLLKYHRKNGGLSRYVKFRYFLKEILGEQNDEKKVQAFADAYSKLMRKELISPKYLTGNVVGFIKENQQHFNMHIVSGSDGNELRYLCQQLGISAYFKTIEGSPTPKITLVGQLLSSHNYVEDKTCLIGDSINDFEAAKENHIQFYGYNNEELKRKNKKYIERFKTN